MTSATPIQTGPQFASRSLEALIADVCRQTDSPATPPVVRVSRMEAILAEVFEKGMAAMTPMGRSGQIFQQAA